MFKKQTIISFIILIIILVGIGVGAWWYLAKYTSSSNYDSFTKWGKKSTTETGDEKKSDYSDKEQITIEALREIGNDENNHYYAIVNIKIDGNWARSGRIPVFYTENNQYEIPECCYSGDFLWEKVESKWIIFGEIAEGGISLNSDMKNRLNEVPISVLSQESRNNIHYK